MKVTGDTNIGMKRQTNQDSYEVGFLEEDVAFAVVCDGMGGANGGNVASQIAVEAITENLKKQYRSGLSGLSIKNLLVTSANVANIKVYEKAKEDESLAGMGTTAVIALVKDDLIHVVNVGDSRAYLVAKDKISQITIDHSVVQALLDQGQISESDVRSYPNRNLITRAIGVSEELEADYFEVEFSEDGVLLICTDGLSNHLEDQDILNIVSVCSFREIPAELIKLANQRGGNDNITVALIAR